MSRTESIFRKVIGQAISVSGGYGLYFLTKDIVFALLFTAVLSRIMKDIGL